MGSPIAFQEVYKAGMEDFVIPVYEDAPFTVIQNRAKVTRSLKAIAGVERVMFRGLKTLHNEFGVNGETVFEEMSKDSRFRFVLSTPVTGGSDGSYIRIDLGGYTEFSFYGTGLNILVYQSTTVRDFRATVDGGGEGANILLSSASPIVGRNYSANIIQPVTSGLALGWHTVKLRNAHASSTPLVFGVEILNDRSDLAVYSGAGISNGSVQGLSALTTSPFKAGVIGTRGARVVKYIQNGAISQAVQEVDSVKYLSLADHTNEEPLRKINHVDFGVNRADDYSTGTAASTTRCFTLDDEVTTLGGTLQWFNASGVIMGNGLNGFTFVTFIGTGLDISWLGNGTPIDVQTVYVDGSSVGVLTPTLAVAGKSVVHRICSGLAYGTHTVRFLNTTDGSDRYLQDIIIYQPKKPSIPSGTFEIADYNVVADYVANTVGDIFRISQGVLRHQLSQRGKPFHCLLRNISTLNSYDRKQPLASSHIKTCLVRLNYPI